MQALAGKNAIVTGASKGIGAAIAVALAEAGANVAINYHRSESEALDVRSRCEALGVKAVLVPGDVGNQADVERMVEKAESELGPLDAAISNAAYSRRELFYEADMEAFERTVQVTMWGAFYLVRAASQAMIRERKQGSIVVVSSPHSWRPFPGAMAYNMSKAAIDQMARTAATELCNRRIRVNIIHPGWVDTPGERQFFTEEKIQRLGAQMPWGRLAKPAEIARGVVFMCDPKNEYVTGSSLLIDGGGDLPVGEMHRLETPEP